MTVEPVETTELQTVESDRSSELTDGKVRRPGTFGPGNKANPWGPKGNPEKRTAMSELRRLADKNATPLARALVKNALNGNVRAWVAMADRAYGVPKQSLEISRADDPLTRWIQGMTGVSIDAVNAGDQPAIDNGYPALPPPTT